jgi:hypothetical protein
VTLPRKAPELVQSSPTTPRRSLVASPSQMVKGEHLLLENVPTYVACRLTGGHNVFAPN